WPGMEGANDLAAEIYERLDDTVSMALPPNGYKDSRELLTKNRESLIAGGRDALRKLGEDYDGHLTRTAWPYGGPKAKPNEIAEELMDRLWPQQPPEVEQHLADEIRKDREENAARQIRDGETIEEYAKRLSISFQNIPDGESMSPTVKRRDAETVN